MPDRAASQVRMRSLAQSFPYSSVVLVCLTSTFAVTAQTSVDSTTGVLPDAPVATSNPPRSSAVRRTKTTKPKLLPANKTSDAALDTPVASAEISPSPSGDAGVDAGPASVLAPTPTLASAASSVTAEASATPPVPSAPASATPVQFGVTEVKIRDTVILRLKLEDGGLVPAERAKRAMRAIEAALADANPETVRTELRQDRALLFVAQRPIVELTRADAEAIGEGSLELFAASAAARVRDVLENERQRSAVAHGVFNVMLVIALAVAVLYALRLLGILARRTREFVHRHPEQIPAIRLRSIEVVGPHVLRSGIVVGLGVLKLLLQLGLVFAWLLFSSSLFEATRGMTGRLTSLVLAPLSGLATRFAALLPLLLLTTIGAVVLVLLLRFVTLFFAGVERRETELSWLRPELAAPTSLLIRIGLVVVSLLVLAPMVTGNVEGSLARVGMLSVVAIALATTPLVANIVVGLVTLYGNRLKLGDEISIASHVGVLASVDLIELRLTTSDGRDLRIPHLVTLVRPLTVATKTATTVRCLAVTAETRFERLVEILGTDKVFSDAASVVLARLEGALTTVELTPKQAGEAAEQQLLILVAHELEAKQIRLVVAEWRNPA